MARLGLAPAGVLPRTVVAVVQLGAQVRDREERRAGDPGDVVLARDRPYLEPLPDPHPLLRAVVVPEDVVRDVDAQRAAPGHLGLQQPVDEHQAARRRAYRHGHRPAGLAHRDEAALPATVPADQEGEPNEALRPRLHLLVIEQRRPRIARVANVYRLIVVHLGMPSSCATWFSSRTGSVGALDSPRLWEVRRRGARAWSSRPYRAAHSHRAYSYGRAPQPRAPHQEGWCDTRQPTPGSAILRVHSGQRLQSFSEQRISPTGRIFVLVDPMLPRVVQVEVHLSGVGVGESTYLQVDDYKTSQTPVEE